MSKAPRNRQARQSGPRRGQAARPQKPATGGRPQQVSAPSGGKAGEIRQGVRRVVVDEDNEGQRLDNFLLAQLRGVPKSIIYRVIRKGEVRVNKGRVKPDTRLKAGDEVRIPPVTRKEKPEQVAPGSRVQGVMENAIVFENEHMLVVNKPSGIAVHGGSGLSFGLIEVLRSARPGTRFLELVHRLDRDTSGLVMVAKKRSALRYLQDELRHKRIRKHYHALVAGDWPDDVSRVEQPLLRYEMPNGERRVRVDEAGKASLTTFRCLSAFGGYSLVEASPVTGRTHQIRVHALWAGHPIAGDDKYMDDVSLKAFRAAGGQRLMLHARALEFSLPVTGEPVRLEAAYDDAFQQFLDRLALRRNSNR
ncbi:23S rRNA pseudouridine(955/2504/2580) synthase RluC [Marinobacter sp. NP-4(2019)]|uniref:23S rRNA pseudouridine(955/2504/2580) synthase RluC n=1 Tax=Marinobacter sp. NP-4(2019) TaxID=2488665 RepID=UPI000FC3F18C|nr:23S rRNA pseudouridine(955/2504/2580) synthase RluC [Marinobacter sp. NP-4(2019)]AZT84341.1 23S rRNA pseudouridine(955/2504/2580) synthase RluC [Marinobacter sp. NP-4(2019)]